MAAALWTTADLKLSHVIELDALREFVEEIDSAFAIELQCVDAHTWDVVKDHSMEFADEVVVVNKNDGLSLHQLQFAGPEAGVKGGVDDGTEAEIDVEPVFVEIVDQIEVGAEAEVEDAEFEVEYAVFETEVADIEAIAYAGDEAEWVGVVEAEIEDKTEVELGDKTEPEKAAARDVEDAIAAVD